MNALFATTLLLLGADAQVEAALQRAVTREGARVELAGWSAPGCRGEATAAPFDASGRVPVRVRGAGCDAWGWAQVRVLVPVVSLTREVKVGDSLDGAWTVAEAEARGETLSSIPTGATAARWLKKGMTPSPADVRVGPKLGTSVMVRVQVGALTLEQRGTISPCSAGATCATLPSGKKVTGAFVGGALIVGGDS
jgi:hypothetical protein